MVCLTLKRGQRYQRGRLIAGCGEVGAVRPEIEVFRVPVLNECTQTLCTYED